MKKTKGELIRTSKLARKARQLTGLTICQYSQLIGVAQATVTYRERAERPGTYLSWSVCRLIVALVPSVISSNTLIDELRSIPVSQKKELSTFAVLIRICWIYNRNDIIDEALGFEFSLSSPDVVNAESSFLDKAQRLKLASIAGELLAMSKVQNNE